MANVTVLLSERHSDTSADVSEQVERRLNVTSLSKARKLARQWVHANTAEREAVISYQSLCDDEYNETWAEHRVGRISCVIESE